jgi:hypothetical protein
VCVCACACVCVHHIYVDLRRDGETAMKEQCVYV